MALRRKRRKLSTQFHSSHSIFTNPLSRFQVQVHTDHSQLHDTKHRIIKYVTICTKRNKRFPRVIPVLEFAILVSWTIPAEIDSDRQSLSSSCLLRPRQLTRHAKVVPGRQRPLASFARNVEYENVCTFPYRVASLGTHLSIGHVKSYRKRSWRFCGRPSKRQNTYRALNAKRQDDGNFVIEVPVKLNSKSDYELYLTLQKYRTPTKLSFNFI